MKLIFISFLLPCLASCGSPNRFESSLPILIPTKEWSSTRTSIPTIKSKISKLIGGRPFESQRSFLLNQINPKQLSSRLSRSLLLKDQHPDSSLSKSLGIKPPGRKLPSRIIRYTSEIITDEPSRLPKSNKPVYKDSSHKTLTRRKIDVPRFDQTNGTLYYKNFLPLMESVLAFPRPLKKSVQAFPRPLKASVQTFPRPPKASVQALPGPVLPSNHQLSDDPMLGTELVPTIIQPKQVFPGDIAATTIDDQFEEAYHRYSSMDSDEVIPYIQMNAAVSHLDSSPILMDSRYLSDSNSVLHSSKFGKNFETDNDSPVEVKPFHDEAFSSFEKFSAVPSRHRIENDDTPIFNQPQYEVEYPLSEALFSYSNQNEVVKSDSNDSQAFMGSNFNRFKYERSNFPEDDIIDSANKNIEEFVMHDDDHEQWFNNMERTSVMMHGDSPKEDIAPQSFHERITDSNVHDFEYVVYERNDFPEDDIIGSTKKKTEGLVKYDENHDHWFSDMERTSVFMYGDSPKEDLAPKKAMAIPSFQNGFGMYTEVKTSFYPSPDNFDEEDFDSKLSHLNSFLEEDIQQDDINSVNKTKEDLHIVYPSHVIQTDLNYDEEPFKPTKTDSDGNAEYEMKYKHFNQTKNGVNENTEFEIMHVSSMDTVPDGNEEYEIIADHFHPIKTNQFGNLVFDLVSTNINPEITNSRANEYLEFVPNKLSSLMLGSKGNTEYEKSSKYSNLLDTDRDTNGERNEEHDIWPKLYAPLRNNTVKNDGFEVLADDVIPYNVDPNENEGYQMISKHFNTINGGHDKAGFDFASEFLITEMTELDGNENGIGPVHFNQLETNLDQNYDFFSNHADYNGSSNNLNSNWTDSINKVEYPLFSKNLHSMKMHPYKNAEYSTNPIMFNSLRSDSDVLVDYEDLSKTPSPIDKALIGEKDEHFNQTDQIVKRKVVTRAKITQSPSLANSKKEPVEILPRETKRNMTRKIFSGEILTAKFEQDSKQAVRDTELVKKTKNEILHKDHLNSLHKKIVKEKILGLSTSKGREATARKVDWNSSLLSINNQAVATPPKFSKKEVIYIPREIPRPKLPLHLVMRRPKKLPMTKNVHRSQQGSHSGTPLSSRRYTQLVHHANRTKQQLTFPAVKQLMRQRSNRRRSVDIPIIDKIIGLGQILSGKMTTHPNQTGLRKPSTEAVSMSSGHKSSRSGLKKLKDILSSISDFVRKKTRKI